MKNKKAIIIGGKLATYVLIAIFLALGIAAVVFIVKSFSGIN